MSTPSAKPCYYGRFSAPFGRMLLACTDQGLSYCTVDVTPPVLERLRQHYPESQLTENPAMLEHYAPLMLRMMEGSETPPLPALDIPPHTDMQWQVWQALRNIPHGQTLTYRELAQRIGKPKAARAVGNACGKNPLCLLIPCHRALRSDGSLGGFSAGGTTMKQRLLDYEHRISSQPYAQVA